MQYIVAVEERRPDCWMLLPPRSGGRRRTGGLAPGGAAEERAGRRRGELGRGGRWSEWRGGTEGEARGEGWLPDQNRSPPPPEPQLALG